MGPRRRPNATEDRHGMTSETTRGRGILMSERVNDLTQSNRTVIEIWKWSAGDERERGVSLVGLHNKTNQSRSTYM